MRVALNYCHLSNWAPAFAGVVLDWGESSVAHYGTRTQT